MEKNKIIDAHYYFDLDVDEDTPDYVVEELFEQALELISQEFYLSLRKKKIETSIDGSISYNVLGDNEDEAYQSEKDKD
jgi:hypothetical protein